MEFFPCRTNEFTAVRREPSRGLHLCAIGRGTLDAVALHMTAELTAINARRPQDDVDICHCLHHAIADYLEMPGLSLTPKQMQRLWSIDSTRCAAVIDALVTARIIRKSANGTYILT
jgi:hypothetical protein